MSGNCTLSVNNPTTIKPPTTATPPGTAQVLGSTSIVTTKGETIQVDKTATGFIFHGYEGKIVLLEVYGDTCPHCVEAIPAYNRLQAKYPDDVVIIALESYGSLNNAGRQQYITIPKAKTGSMFSFIQSLTGYNRQAVPYLMIFDRNGNKVYNKILANFPENDIDNRIQQLL
jgi:thiol-disulfide isomerase/thioredoxin